MTVRSVSSTLSLLSALLAACSELHSGQAGDTNTSWLRICEDRSDCAGGARCLSHLCTLPCTRSDSNSCAELSEAATCRLESGMCDVSCDTTQDCRALGADYRCEAGSCRPVPELSLSAETLRITPDQAQLTLGSGRRDTQAIWLEDRFRVGATVSEQTGVQPDVDERVSGFVVADLFPDGRVERHFLPDSGLGFVSFTLGQNGGVANTDAEKDPSDAPRSMRCSLTFYDSDLAPVSTEMIACDPGFGPITDDASGDWLMWANPYSGGWSLGRYRPSELRWTEEPQPLAMVDNGFSVSTQLRDDQFWIQTEELRWGTSSLISVPLTGSLGDVSVPEAWQALSLQARTLNPPNQSIGWRGLVYRDGWLIPFDETFGSNQTEPVVPAIPVEAGQSQQPVSFSLDAAGTIGFSTLRQIPGRDLVAICYVDLTAGSEAGPGHCELKLSWFDTRGTALGEPLLLASSDRNLGKCTLTWSGSSLLATWTDGVVPDEPGAAYARRVRVY